MKKIKLLISLLLINFCAYSQTIPEVPINQFTQAGYLNSKYYPIGWSEDERYFALMILSESNYASLPEGHGFDFLIKDVVTDKDAYIKSYSGYDICEGKFDAYGQGECDFSAKGIFELHKATFTEALNKYNINTKTPLAYSTFPIKNAEGESISIQNYKVEKDGYISMETLTATNNQQGSKTILQSTYDSNFRRLASEIVGAFVSPSKERLLVIQKYTSSGIEGDREIELNFIGCHTQKGYQFNDVVESKKAYVIATNVNIRNKPNISESKVLFQLNKVEWVKYQTYPDSAMTNWTGFRPTPVEIIDSTVTDGNKWYKIKGAKLTKEEIDNLSKWGDWDTVRDSLFNLDDMGNKIRQDNSNREHWIYHTLVHRFQNNSFKDGKYSASKVAEASYKKENWKDVNDYVNFTIDGYNVKGELGYHPAEMDGITCDIYGYKSADGKHLNLKSTCYSEGDTYEGGTYQITLMDNNAFKLDFTSSRGNFNYNFYRYEFEEDISIDRKIIPNESVGLITSSTTKSALNKLYDKGNIRETIKGTEVIFDNTADNITIEWNDGNLTPKIIRIKNPNSNWKTKEGVGIGSTIKEVEKANGKPFTIYGYEIDKYLAGTVKNWNSGNLQGLNLQFKITKEIPVEVYMKMMGDRGILSNNPLLEKAGLQVENITVEFNK